jgi:hypothetical protein
MSLPERRPENAALQIFAKLAEDCVMSCHAQRDGKVSWLPRSPQAPKDGYSYNNEEACAASFLNGAFPHRRRLPLNTQPCMTANQKIKNREVRSLPKLYDWNDFIDEQSFANALRTALISGNNAYPATVGLLIDTSRNGWGGPNRMTGPSISTDLREFVRATTLDDARRMHPQRELGQSERSRNRRATRGESCAELPRVCLGETAG